METTNTNKHDTQTTATKKDTKYFLTFLGVAYFYGLLILVFGSVWTLITRGSFPQGPWWLYPIAPLSIGLAGLAIDAVSERTIDLDKTTDPLWKRALRAVLLIIVLFSIVMVSVIYGN